MRDEPTSHYSDHMFLGDAHDRNARRTLIVVLLNAAAMVAEIVWGWLTGSMALLADGVHMATDAGALAIAAGAYAYARRHAENARYTFGTGKVGDLAAFASAIILGLASVGIAVEAVLRLFDPRPVVFGEAILVAVIGLIVNVGSALLLARDGHGHHHGHGHDGQGHDRQGNHGHADLNHHAHGHDRDGHRHAHHHDHAHERHEQGHTQDNNLRAAYLHLVADALTSVLAIAALAVARYTGWLWLDAAAGLLGAVLIARWSIMLMRAAAGVLLDTADPVLLARVRGVVEGSGAQIADLHIWRIGPVAHAAIVSVRGGDAAAIRAALEEIAALGHVTVECR